jgi:hypothetical protein
MIAPDSLSVWLEEQAWCAGLIAFSIAAGLLLLKLSAQRRIRVLSRRRKRWTEYSFVDHLERFDFDPLIAGATYRYLQHVQGIRFPLLPSDKLDEDLGLDCDDQAETVRELLLALRREELPGLRYEPLLTVEDLMRLLQASPRWSRERRAA